MGIVKTQSQGVSALKRTKINIIENTNVRFERMQIISTPMSAVKTTSQAHSQNLSNLSLFHAGPIFLKNTYSNLQSPSGAVRQAFACHCIPKCVAPRRNHQSLRCGHFARISNSSNSIDGAKKICRKGSKPNGAAQATFAAS